MKLSNISLEDLLLSAIKSEVESKKIYEDLARKVKNFMLKDRFKFLADEEEKHRAFFEWLYKNTLKAESSFLRKIANDSFRTLKTRR